MLLKFDLTGVQTHDLQIMDSISYVSETLVLTTAPSGTTLPCAEFKKRIYAVGWFKVCNVINADVYMVPTP